MNTIRNLETPLFYRYPIGLRFEIGPTNIGTFSDSYFDVARTRAARIFDSVFEHEDELELLLQQFSEGRSKIRPTNGLLSLCVKAKLSDICFTRRRDVYADDLQNRAHHWCRSTMTLRKVDVDWNSVFDLIVRSDFGSGFHGECYLLNRRRTVAFHLYDDRGLDLVAVNEALLSPIFWAYRDWILRHDEQRMVAIFENTEQPGTGQPATRPVDEPEGSVKPQPEAEGRSR